MWCICQRTRPFFHRADCLQSGFVNMGHGSSAWIGQTCQQTCSATLQTILPAKYTRSVFSHPSPGQTDVRNGFTGYWWWENPRGLHLISSQSVLAKLVPFLLWRGFRFLYVSRCGKSKSWVMSWIKSRLIQDIKSRWYKFVSTVDFDQTGSVWLGRKGSRLAHLIACLSAWKHRTLRCTERCTISRALPLLCDSQTLRSIVLVSWYLGGGHDGEVTCDVML